MQDERLLPLDANQIAVDCFAVKESKRAGQVTRKYIAKGLFPEHDFDLPSATRGKHLWFAATVTAWRRKYFALQVVNRQRMRELEAEEQNELRLEMLRKATAYAEKISADLMAEITNDEQRDADHDVARA